jgi:hypothetical protein
MRIAAWVIVAGAAVWSAALIAGPFLRPDLDAITAHPEDYARGPWALLMQAGYVGIAVAGAAAAVLAARRRVAAVLLALFALGALTIGLLPPTGGTTPADDLFPYLQLAPLAFLPAIAWISWRERHKGLVLVAAVTWVLFLPLVLGEPPIGGMLNRAADLAMGAWLIAFAESRRV